MTVQEKRKRIKEIDHAIYMYGLDAWGTSAFGNMKTIERLEKEKEKLLRNKKWWQFWIAN